MHFIDLKSQYTALKTDIHARMQTVLDHGQYIMGPEVAELEAALAARVGVPHCITVASGTEALLISLMALDLQPGDEVVTTPFTFAATAEVIVLLGGVPVFVDVEADTGLIDAQQIEAALTPRTRAILPVSLYGQVADMDAIQAVADRHGLPVIEDAAQSFGASLRNAHGTRLSGGLSTLGCTSFFPSKPLGCYGDGGAIFTADAALAQACREIRVHGQSARYTHTRVGVGGRMDTLQCAVVLAKLGRFDWELARRAEVGARYDAAFDAAGVERMRTRPGRTSVHGQYTVQVPARDAVQAALTAQGVPTAVHYPRPMNQQPAYARHATQPTPVADALAERVLSLPMSADLSEADQDRVIATLLKALRG
ncbi:aminotransferase DegT [Comamonas serinivorans]|uniref:Aminotransferase DegT n=1 Tax=Comamonas serinivorans TaxID=1082851 RepID=A0A1Y0ETJ4_9BURK|nr:DegT/DnrJ/EryC1/StrS family aminotransferase [Comamonas serinivorans]ARU06730.1 aminotransferase DegT [Comamonas serinivorans]